MQQNHRLTPVVLSMFPYKQSNKGEYAIAELFHTILRRKGFAALWKFALATFFQENVTARLMAERMPFRGARLMLWEIPTPNQSLPAWS